MAQDQPETPREQLARQAVQSYNELTAHAEELSPEAAQAVRSLRETLTSLVALGTAADLPRSSPKFLAQIELISNPNYRKGAKAGPQPL